MDDMCENVECVCSILITVGSKLDTTKAKVYYYYCYYYYYYYYYYY